MTLFDFIYGIGSGVAFIMALVGLTAENNKMPEADRCHAGVIVCSLFCASLSWAIPIWWLGFEIYKKLIKQDKLKKENQQLKELLKECADSFDYLGIDDLVMLTKIDNAIGEKK